MKEMWDANHEGGHVFLKRHDTLNKNKMIEDVNRERLRDNFAENALANRRQSTLVQEEQTIKKLLKEMKDKN